MQTVQFKVLNTDTQETKVQMQTENTEAESKVQNTQNTEMSGVESTGESTGTKKKASVVTGKKYRQLQMWKVPNGLPVCS